MVKLLDNNSIFFSLILYFFQPVVLKLESSNSNQFLFLKYKYFNTRRNIHHHSVIKLTWDMNRLIEIKNVWKLHFYVQIIKKRKKKKKIFRPPIIYYYWVRLVSKGLNKLLNKSENCRFFYRQNNATMEVCRKFHLVTKRLFI